jgi:ribosomal protein S18 acetylase RimI-like enzyme
MAHDPRMPLPDVLPRPTVRLATLEDAEPIADLLADAFLDYEWSRWAVPADNRHARLRGLHLLYAGLLGAEAGSTWVTDDISSVAAWVKPGRTPISDGLRARLDEESAALFGDRLDAVDALDAETAPLRPAGPHWYLATVGTRPDRQREGLASLVIRAGLAACDQAGLPAAVETSNEANCRLYERLGFAAAGDRTAPDGGLRVWVLVRPAQH